MKQMNKHNKTETDTGNKLLVTRGRTGWEAGETDEGNEETQTSSQKISRGNVMYSQGNMVNNTGITLYSDTW